MHRKQRGASWWGILVALVWLLAAAPVTAQHIIIEPPFPPFPPQVPVMPVPGAIQIDDYRVAAEIDGPAAHVRVTQVFENRSGQVVEGRFIFPLPANAVVSDLQMKVDGEVLEGKLLPSDEARAIYEQIVRQQRDPALLQYVGQGLFQTNVFPIPPGVTRAVQFQYTQLVEQREGLFHFRYPLRGQPGGAGDAQFEMTVELVNQPGLRTLYSPNHNAAVERTGTDAAEVRLAGALAQADPTFDLFWGVADEVIGLNLLSYRPAGEDGFFVLLASPAVESEETEVVARDIVVVLDVSGSMEGEKMEQARRAVDYVIDQLRAGDRVNIVAFSTGVHLWNGSLQPVTEETIQDAHQWVARLDAGGSTDINRALLEALAQVGDGEGVERPAYVLFMTDGLPTQGETDPWRIVDNAHLNAPADRTLRLFTFGVGYDVDTQLLDTLSAELGGRSSYVLPQERIDEAVSAFYQGIETPVLTDIEIELGGNVLVDELYPYPLPDLFAGEQMVVAGRYREGGVVPVTLRGSVNGAERVFEFPSQELVKAGGEPFVARLWASRKIGVLMAEIRRNGPSQELVDAIVDLSLEYGIVTPYTAYLVEEPTLEPQTGMPGQPAAPLMPNMGGGAPVDMRPAAEAYAADEAARMAEMPASGAGAVAASQAQNELQTASTVTGAEAMANVGGKTFVRQGYVTGGEGQTLPFWVDTSYSSGMALRYVLFGSDAYFELAQDATVAAWLSVGSEVVVVLPEVGALRVTTLPELVDDAKPLPVSPLATPEPERMSDEAGGWNGFWGWLWEDVIR